MQSLADRLAADQSWRTPYQQLISGEALSLAEGLPQIGETYDRQRAELDQKFSERFGGGHVSGGTYALDRREEEAKRRLMQESAQRGAQYAASEAAQANKLRMFEAQLGQSGVEADMRYEMQGRDIEARDRLAQLQATVRQLDREATKEIAMARNNLDQQRIANEYKLRRAQIIVQMKSIGEQISASKFRRGALGGGLQVTKTELSPGGAGRSGMNPASRHAWG